MLHHPCILGGPTTPSAGNKITSGYRNPAFSRAQMRVEVLHHPCILGGPTTPSAGNKIRSGYLTPIFWEAQKRAEMLHHPCILGGPQGLARGTKSEVATSILPSKGPKRGLKCYITPAFSGVPNAKRGEQNQMWLAHLCLLGGPKEG